MIKKLAIFLFAAFLVFAAVYVWRYQRAKTTPNKTTPPISYATRPAVGYLAPNFLLNTLDGRPVRLSDNLGRVTLVTFWASWCPFCAGELRDFDRLRQQYGNRLAVLAINRGETPATAANFLRLVGVSPAVTFLLDPTDSIYPRYQATTMPETYLIDQQGVIRVITPAVLDLASMRSLVAPYLK